MSVKVTQAFRDAFKLVHQAFGSTPEEIESEKQRIRAGGETALPRAEAYYQATAALLRAGWNPKLHPHVQLWKYAAGGAVGDKKVSNGGVNERSATS